MKKQLAFVLTVSVLSMTSCYEEPVRPNYKGVQADPTAVKKIGISSFYPEAGKGGSTIAIFGENFGATKGDNNVTFGGQYAEIIDAQSAILVVRVPMNLKEGSYVVSVSANGGTAEGGSAFKVTTEN